MKRHTRIPYKEVGGKTLTLDLYLPDAQPDSMPLMIIIHGGAWCVDNTGLQRKYARAVAEAGLGAAAIVGFRLVPPDKIYGQIADIKDAIRFLRAKAGEYGYDPARFGMYGSSSGSHLAALAAFTRNGDGFTDDAPGESSAVQALFCLYGIYDLTRPPPAWARLLLYPVYRYYLGEWHSADSTAYRKVSPIRYVHGGAPRTLLVHGTRDTVTPLSEAYRLAGALADAGADAGVVEVPNGIHGFSETMPWTRAGTCRLFLDFVRDTFGPATPCEPGPAQTIRERAGSVT